MRNHNGRVIFLNGDVYEGQIKDDKAHGIGTLTLASGEFEGDVFVGSFEEGLKSGLGKYT